MRALIIGGDRRMIFTKKALEKSGYAVNTLGLLPDDNGDITAADTVILPVPVTRDKVNINCALSGRTIPLAILTSLPENTSVFGGGGISVKNYTDYLALDEYAVKNAVLTAEGAISHIIENTEFSLWKSKILIIGYGRVGRALYSRLAGFCAFITVSARNRRDFAVLDSLGIDRIETGDIGSVNRSFNIVINTVDIKFEEPVARALSPALFIDLSTHGGFTDNAAAEYGLTYKKLPGIPAVCAPETAGEIIAETVISLQRPKGE